jgi:hypothetical protein
MKGTPQVAEGQVDTVQLDRCPGSPRRSAVRACETVDVWLAPPDGQVGRG